MSTQIDNQIVKMEFDNKKFEKNVSTSLNTIQKLKKALNFDEQTKTMKELEKAANHLTLDDVGATLDKLADKFSVMGIAGMTVVQDLTRGFENFAKKMTGALTAPIRQIQNGGWARAMKIKDAEFTMKGLNILGDKLEAIKKDIDYAVSGTAYGYESAASAAAQFAASNVQIGDSMQKALRSISGIAAQTNSSYDDIAGIFTTIAANGKLMTQQLRQLSFRGMNASAVLAKSMHTSEAAIAEMVRKGEIDFATFAKAMDDAFGEHAKAANETFQGALDNMKASLSRVGADFATPWIDFQRDVFNSTRLILNSLRKETGALDTFMGTYNSTVAKGINPDGKQIANLNLMTNVMNKTKLSINENTQALMKRYDHLAKLNKRTKEQEELMKKLKKQLKASYEVDENGTTAVGEELNILLDQIKRTGKATDSQKVLLKQLKDLAGQTKYYMGGAAENAVERINKLADQVEKDNKRIEKLKSMTSRTAEQEKQLEKLESRVEKTREKIDKLTDKATDKVVVGSTNSVSRLVETYKGILADVRLEVLNFLNDPKLVYGINNFVDGLNYLLQFLNKFAQPIKNAWRSIFPESEADVIFNITEKFKKFMQDLRLSTEGADKVESIFRGIASALFILRTVVGDMTSVITTLAKPAVDILIDVFSILGEAMVTVEWRFRQIRAALIVVIKHFTKVITGSKTFKVALSGLSTVISALVTAFTVLGRIIGTVVVVAILGMLSALDKLATNLDNILEFVTPIGKALLYVFSTVGSIVVKGIEAITKPLSIFKKETKEANKAIGTFGASTISPLQKFANVAAAVSTTLRDLVVNGLTNFGNKLKGFSLAGLLQQGLDRVKVILDGFKNGFLSLPEMLGKGMATLVSLIVKGLGTIVSGIGAFIKAFLEAKVNVETGATVLDTLKEKFGGIIDAVENFKKSFEENGTFNKFKEKLNEISDAIKGFTETITPAKLFAVTFTAAVALMTVSLFNLINSISTFMTFATQVPMALAEMLKSIKTLFQQLTARIAPVKKASTQFKEVAEAIGIIAAAVYFLGNMEDDKITQGTAKMWEIVIMLGAVMAIFKAVSLIQKKVYGPGQLAASGKAFVEMMNNVMSVSMALIAAAVALNVLSRANFDGTVDAINKIGAAILAIAGVYATMALISRFDQGVQSSAAAIIAFAGSLYIMVLALEKLNGMPIQDIFYSLKALIPCIAVLAVLAIAVNTVTITNGAGLFLALAALWVAVPLLKKLSKIDFSGLPLVLKDFISMMALFAILAGLINAVAKRNILASFESFGKGMMSVASSMLIMVGVIALLGSLNKAVIKKGIAALTMLTAMIVAMEIFATHTIGNGMKDFGVGVLLITASFILMTGLVAVLGSLDIASLAKGIAAIGILTAYVIAMMYASKLVKKIDWSSTALFIGFSLDIIALAAALVLLAQIPWKKLATATAGLSVTLLAYGKTCEMILKYGANFKGSKAKVAMFIGMILVIAELAGALFVLSKCPWKNLLSAAFAMSATIMAFGGSMAVMASKFKGLPTKVGPLIASFVMMMLSVGAIAKALFELSKQPWDQMMAGGVAMGLCLVAYGVAFRLIATSINGKHLDKLADLFIQWFFMMTTIAALMGALYLLSTRPWDQMLAAGGAMGACLLAYGKAFEMIANSAKKMNLKDASTVVGTEVALCGAILVLGWALGNLAQYPWDRIIASGVSMGVCLLAYAGAFNMIAAGNFATGWDDVIKMAAEMAILCVVVVGIGHVLGKLAEHDWRGIAVSAGSVALVLITMAGIIDLMSFIPFYAGINAALGIITFVGTLAACMAIIDAVFSSGGKSGTEKIADEIEKLGKIFGAFVNGFVSGATEDFAEAGKRLSEFATNAKDFFELASQFNGEGSTSGLSAMTGLFKELAKAEFIEGLNVFGHLHESLTGTDQIDEIGNDLYHMAEIMGTFYVKTNNIKADKLIKQCQALGELLEAISYIPAPTTSTTADGYALSSTIDYETFGHQLEKLGEALVTFQDKTKELKTSSIENASTAMGMINAFCSEIPNSGSTFLKWIIGDNEVGDFAAGLEKLGPALEKFSMAAKFVDQEAVEGAGNCIGILSAFAEDMPKTGGWDQVFKGSADVDGFANALPNLGTQLKDFSNNVNGLNLEAGEIASHTLLNLADAARDINEGGMDTFKNFAEGLPTAGSNIKSFFAEIQDGDVYDNTKVTNFCLNVRRLVELNDDISKTQQTGFKDLANSIKDLSGTGLTITAIDTLNAFKESMDAAISEINQKEQTFIEAGQTTIQNFIDGMDERMETVKSKATEVCIRAKGVMEKYYNTYYGIGKISAENYARGMESGEAKRRVRAAAQTLADLASSGSVSTDTTASAMSDISTNVVNALRGVNDQATNFASAAGNLMNNFIGGLDAGITAIKDYGNKISNPITTQLTSNDTMKKYKKAGSDATDRFGDGITNYSSLKYVRDQATRIGNEAVKALDAAIKDPVGVSDETYKLGNAFANGFSIGMRNSTKAVLEAAAKMGAESIKTLDETIHDPKILGVDVSLDSFNLGKAFGAGYQKGIEIFNGAVNKAASILGIEGISGLDDVLKNFGNKGKEAGDNFLGQLYEAVIGEKRKNKGEEDVDSLFGGFFKDLKDDLDEALGDANDVGAAIDNAKKTGDKKGKGKSAAKWTNKDVASAMASWLAVTEDFTVKYDAFNASLLEKGKITVKYLAQSAGSDKLRELIKNANKAKKTMNDPKVSAKEREAAKKQYEAYRKQIEEETKKTNNLRKTLMALKDSDIKDLNKELKKQAKEIGYKVGTKEYNNLAKQIASKRLKSLESSFNAFNAKVKEIFKGDKSLQNVALGVTGFGVAWLRNYDAQMKSVQSVTKKYAKQYGNGGTSSKAYKKVTKQIESESSKLTRLNKKIRKQQAIIDDPKSTKKQIKAAQSRLDIYKARKRTAKANLEDLNKKQKKYQNTDDKALQSITNLGERLYKKSDEYKKASKDLVKLTKKQENLEKKANKQRDIINDPKASAERKLAAKKRLESYKSQSKSIKSEMASIAKSIAKGPERAIKKLKKEIKSAAKEFLSFSNISFDKVLEGFDKKSKSTSLQAQTYDIFTHSMINTTEAIKSATDAYGLLNVNVETGINLLERFGKVGSTSAKKLLRNAQDQLRAYEEYKEGLAKLSAAGLDDSMMKQLKEQGVSALSTIRGFLKMTPQQIRDYNTLIAKEKALEAQETESAMKEQVSTYKEWVDNLAKLSGKIPVKMLEELRNAGVSNADFVKTLLYMDDTTLSEIASMYEDGLKAAVDAATKSVVTANEGRSFLETIEKNAADAAAKKGLIEKFEKLGLSKEIVEKFKSLGLPELQAYYDEISKIAEEGTDKITYINEQYEKSLYDGRPPIDIWLENMTATDDLYAEWQGKLKKVAKALKDQGGENSPLYIALRSMGMEEGSVYADAFINGTNEQREAIVKEFNRQQDLNDKAIIQGYKDRIAKIQQWKKDIEYLASLTYSRESKKGQKIIGENFMAELIAAGPDDYEKVHALVEMGKTDIASLSQEYEEALKIPEEVSNSVMASYANLIEPAVEATSKTIKESGGKNGKTTKAMEEASTEATKNSSKKRKEDGATAGKETVDATTNKVKSTESKTTATNAGVELGNAIYKGVKGELSKKKAKTIGKNFVNGLAEGIQLKESVAQAAATALGEKAYKAVKKALKIKSPSKMTEELGMYFDLGFVSGLEKYQDQVTDSASIISDNLLEAFRQSIILTNDVINSEGALNPVIQPTLDLSNAEKETSLISAQMSTTRDIVVTLNDKANEDVIRAIERMDNNFESRFHELSEAVDNMNIYLDSGALVGELAGPMDSAMGKMMANKRRGM